LFAYDFELFNQLSNSIQRQIRFSFGKDECENVPLFLKILKVATSESKRTKPKKILSGAYSEIQIPDGELLFCSDPAHENGR